MKRNATGRPSSHHRLGRWRVPLLGIASFAWASAALAAAPPLPLLGGRFEVQTTWRAADGRTGMGTPSPLTAETGTFWFFSPTNVELVVKVLDACSNPSQRFWVFAAGLTDVEVEMTVTDTSTGEAKTYRNPRGTPFQPIQDTGAFATCGAPARCGQGTFAEISQTPRGDRQLETLALLMAGTIAAPQDLYDRLVADVAAIRQQRPNLNLDFSPRYDPQSLILSVPRGTTPPWDCLNRWYRVDHIQTLTTLDVVFLHFAGVLNVARLQADYAALPGVGLVELNEILPPPLPIPHDTFCASADGGRNFYFVWPVNQPIEYFTSEPGALPVARGPVEADLQVAERAARCFHDWTV